MNSLKYFAYFRYVPTLSQYYCFAKSKQLPKGARIIRGRVVTKLNVKFLKETLSRKIISQKKIEKHKKILAFLGNLPWVQYLGFSGSASMLNAKEEDDLDLFVITKANRLWTARFFLILITSVLGKRRYRLAKKVKDKFCLNLFFSEQNLKTPKRKQTEYVAHEVLQLKTIVNKNQTYERLLKANPWIFKLFPQAKKNTRVYPVISAHITPGVIERMLGKWQRFIISKHQTTELITDTQLWFFPDDFEKRLAKTS